jgi:endonuclease/exonuclease/phosphatase family metal-dependent hydrolase
MADEHAADLTYSREFSRVCLMPSHSRSENISQPLRELLNMPRISSSDRALLQISDTAPKHGRDVAFAKARVEKREKTLTKLKVQVQRDGSISPTERKSLDAANARLNLSNSNLTLQKVEASHLKLAKSAVRDSAISRKERDALVLSKKTLSRFTAERLSERRKLLDLLEKTGSGSTNLVVSSFNVLGSSHTGAGSDHPGVKTGVKRMRYTAKLFEQHGIDVAGLQECQADQFAEFNKLTNHKYAAFPGTELGRNTVNSIVWDKSKWTAVEKHTIDIPYFGGHREPMPYVLLQNKQTGQRTWVANFHNPASTKHHPDQQRFRNAATDKEIALVKRLEKKTGLPVVLTGDMNENAEYYKRMTAGTNLESSHKGPNGSRPNDTGIDWIFGSPSVHFSGYDRSRDPLVKKASDHPIVVSNAKIDRVRQRG